MVQNALRFCNKHVYEAINMMQKFNFKVNNVNIHKRVQNPEDYDRNGKHFKQYQYSKVHPSVDPH